MTYINEYRRDARRIMSGKRKWQPRHKRAWRENEEKTMFIINKGQNMKTFETKYCRKMLKIQRERDESYILTYILFIQVYFNKIIL